MKKRILLFLIIIIAAAICAACTFADREKPTGSPVVFSEICSSNSGSFYAGELGTCDWIELYNTSGEDIDISGWRISKGGKPQSFEVPAGSVVSAGGYIVICANANMDGGYYDYPSVEFNLSKNGCELTLSKPDGANPIDVQVPELSPNITYCRVGDEWKFSANPTPGEANKGPFSDTLDGVFSAAAEMERPVINEATREWVELYNPCEIEMPLSVFYITDDSADAFKRRLPDIMLPPGGYYTVYFADGDFVVSKQETEICLACGGRICEVFGLDGLTGTYSIGLNDNGDKVFFAEPTPGERNSLFYADTMEFAEAETLSELWVNEILLKNTAGIIDSDGDRSDWVELYNPMDISVELSRYCLSDDENDPLKWQLPDETLESGKYKLIFLSGKSKEGHAPFKVGDGESFILTDRFTLSYEKITVPDGSRLKNISYGRKEGEWLYFGTPTPGEANTAAGSAEIENVQLLPKFGVWINEVSAAVTPKSSETDWIELYNDGETNVSLEGWKLGFDAEFSGFELSGSVPAKGYAVITASDNEDKHADIAAGLGLGGETLYLLDSAGNIRDIFETGALSLGVTSGRKAADYSGSRVFFNVPTKGGRNSDDILGGKLNPPAFSVRSGYIDGGTRIEISAPEGASIYYTTDGREASKNGNLYTDPIMIDKNTVISAIACKEGRVSSDAAYATYILDKPSTLPTVCMSIAPDDLNEINADTEALPSMRKLTTRKCYIEYFNNEGEFGVGFPAGVRITGNSTRIYPQRSYALYLKSGYGQSSVIYPFFEDYPITEFKSLLLRNAGQDNEYARMRDAYTGELFADMYLDDARTRFVTTYINGRYWGIYDLKENLNEDFLAATHGVDVNEINIIKRNTAVLEGSNSDIKKIYEYAQSWNCSKDEVYDKFCNYVDEKQWIDYIIARGFTGDYDMFNQKLWGTSSYSWRYSPVFYDCDFAFKGVPSNTLDKYFHSFGVASKDGSLTNMWIPCALKQNSGWCDMFLERLCEVMKTLPEKSLDLFDKMYAEIEPEMERHIARWGKPVSMNAWNNEAKDMRRIIEARPKTLLKQVKQTFAVSDERMHELFPMYY